MKGVGACSCLMHRHVNTGTLDTLTEAHRQRYLSWNTSTPIEDGVSSPRLNRELRMANCTKIPQSNERETHRTDYCSVEAAGPAVVRYI